ncbi:UNVERIFIED_CONTAM: hypothetical protein FKN15_006324 [Acipenser sinensis]
MLTFVYCLFSLSRLTKPLSFADCVGDELPWGWEAAYDPQIGIYYMDHTNRTTQLEDPRKQWRKEQERMLKEYLTVAQDALSTQKELYQVKEQRLALALDEYVRLNDAYKEKSCSRTSLFSGSSSSTKYDPDILKAEISTTKVRNKAMKPYNTVAQDALSTQKELYQVKEQRLALALDEYVRLNDAYKEKSCSRTSLFSGSSSSTKYDPDILKAEISTTKVRVNKLKRELSQMKQELLYKEQGYETLQQIDQKIGGGQSGYELKEAKAIVSELKSIRKAISSGEKEKQDLMQVNKLKRELSQMKQELLYKEQGYETLQQIDQKIGGGQSGYELKEAKAIVSELKSIRKTISSGEKEKQDLMQSLVKLKERFHSDQFIDPDLRSTSAGSHLSLSRQRLDAGSQTDISGELGLRSRWNLAEKLGLRSRWNLAEKVRLSLQYEEAKRRYFYQYPSPQKHPCCYPFEMRMQQQQQQQLDWSVEVEDTVYIEDDLTALEAAQVQIGLKMAVLIEDTGEMALEEEVGEEEEAEAKMMAEDDFAACAQSFSDGNCIFTAEGPTLLLLHKLIY